MDEHAPPRGARARVRAELTEEIKVVARRQLVEHGAVGLSLRAVAREMGMVSSALYRYFPGRTELLTALIVDAYNAIATACEVGESAVRRGDLLGRWMAATRAARSWAVANPQEYALIFGSPISGYQAPADTIDPAARIPRLLLEILQDAADAGKGASHAGGQINRGVRSDLKQLRAALGTALLDHQLAGALMAWTELIGSISFELFGHLHNVIHDYESYFDYQLRGIGRRLGLD